MGKAVRPQGGRPNDRPGRHRGRAARSLTGRTATAALEAIEAASREAIGELRAILGVLREGAAEAAQMEAGFAGKGVALERRLERTEIEGDPDRLAQIVANLLSNALRYTEPGGRVELQVASEDGSAVLEVGDTGVGISPEDLPHIFKRFWRADRSRSRQTGGAGIGLAIVRELVIAHEGRIEVDSTPGRGSRFRVVFPSSAMPAHGADLEAADHRPTQGASHTYRA